MKRVLFGLVLSLLVVPGLFAATVTISSGAFTGPSGGGEFYASGSGLSLSAYSTTANTRNAGGTIFQTFCIEKNEFLTPGSTYNFVPNSMAVGGGLNVPPGIGDPISIGTAYLYSQFAAGTLTGYNYANTGGTRNVYADALQKAIWALEEEEAGTSLGAYAAFLVSVNAGWTTTAADRAAHTGAYADANGAYGVMALNLTDSSGGVKQDVLYVPDGGITLLLMGIGLSALGLARKFSL